MLRRAAAEALLLCGAHSAGASAAAIAPGSRRPLAARRGIVGPWARVAALHTDALPIEAMVMEARAPHLCSHPDVRWPELALLDPPATEMFAVPLTRDGHAFGGLWMALHDRSRRFTAEDCSQLCLLAQCVSAAFDVAVVTAPPWWHHTVAPHTPRQLSAREKQVCLLVAHGHTNKVIGERLGVGTKTVETYRARVADKLGFRGRADFIAFAASHSWL